MVKLKEEDSEDGVMGEDEVKKAPMSDGALKFSLSSSNLSLTLHPQLSNRFDMHPLCVWF